MIKKTTNVVSVTKGKKLTATTYLHKEKRKNNLYQRSQVTLVPELSSSKGLSKKKKKDKITWF